MDQRIQHHFVRTNGIRLHVAAAGRTAGPLILLLHGFPEYWAGWRRQIPALARAGFHVWAPDQRGYNLSDKPRGVAAYRLDETMRDALGLIDAAGRERAIVVGHDWGGVVAWCLATRHPERVDRLIILNAPHPKAMLRHVLSSPKQMIRSAYVLFFQLPLIPERFSRRNNWAAVARALRATADPRAFTAPDLEAYRRAWSRPGAYTAMLNWYRAAVRYPPDLAGPATVASPTAILWGARDFALSPALAAMSLDLCVDGRLITLPEATHWLHREEPARVNALIAAFAAGDPLPPA